MITKTQPLCTIAIPTYNRANLYLRQAIESAVSQTYPNIEIIVSDNCSDDDTETVVKSFRDIRIRYYKHEKNMRAIDNFNFCIQQAKGEFFLLLHDDDLIDRDFIETCLKAANYDTNIGIIRTGMRRIDSQGKMLGKSLNRVGGLSTEDFFIGIFTGKTPTHLCCTLFNTKRLIEIGGLRSRHQLFADVIAEVIIAAKFGRVDIKEMKASFRMHHLQSHRSATINAWCEDSLILLNTMYDLASKKKELVKTEGWRFINHHNYRLVRKMKSPLERFRTYLVVYKKLDCQYSPLHFFFDIYIHRIRQIKDKLKQVLIINRLDNTMV